MKTTMVRPFGVLFPAVLAVFILMSCNLDLANQAGTVKLDLAQVSDRLFRALDTSPDGASVSSLRISLSDSAGESVIDQTFTAPQTASAQALLKRGESYSLAVEVIITPGYNGVTTRTWTNSQDFTVPTTGTSFDLVVSITRINLTAPVQPIAVGAVLELLPEVTSSNEIPPSLVWSSSDDTIATVDAQGRVTGIAVGAATITVFPDDNGFGTSIPVTVGSTNSLSLTVNFSDPTQPDMTFTGTQSISILPTSSMTLSIPAGFSSYAWYLNGGDVPFATTQSITLTGNDPGLKLDQINRLFVVAGQGTEFFSADVPFDVTSPFSGGTAVSGYQITTAAQLDLVRLYPDAMYILMNDITLSGSWTPIPGFTGEFHGMNHIISGLNVSGSGNLGLFAELVGTAVKQVKIDELQIVNATVNGTGATDNAGILAGTSNQAMIRRCVVNGSVSVNNGTAGSLIGSMTDTLIEECVSGMGGTNSVTAISGVAGGLAGLVTGLNNTTPYSGYQFSSLLGRTWSNANVTAGNVAGGLIGKAVNQGSAAGTSVGISESYHQGVVRATGTTGTAGGLVGTVDDAAAASKGFYLENSYSTSTISAGGSSGVAGGLIGAATNSILYMRYCYFAGTANAPFAGAVAGTLDSATIGASSGTYNAIFWDYERSALNDSVSGASLSNAFSRSTSVMRSQSTFSAYGFSFSGTWKQSEGQSYPYLGYQGSVNLPWEWTTGTNRVTNPGYEAAMVLDLAGWNLVPAGNWTNYPAGHSASYYSLQASGTSASNTKTQTVDLVAAGYTSASLASPSVSIRVGEWVRTNGAGIARYSLTVRLRNSALTELAVLTTGEMRICTSNWANQGLEFRNLTGLSDLRYVEIISSTWSDSGSSTESALLDDTSLVVVP